MKIHVSENTKLLLDEIGGFYLEKRGNIEIKVKVSIPKRLHFKKSGFYFREKGQWKHFGC
jgi:hypothetical protein